MTIGRFFLFILAAPFLWIAVVLIDVNFTNAYRWSYRLTVEVEVDGKVRSGSSIYGLVTHAPPRLFPIWPTKSVQTRSYGVSPLIDLGRHGTLVAAQAYNHSHYVKYREERGVRNYDYTLDPNRPLWPSQLPYYAYIPKLANRDTWPEPHRTIYWQRDRVQSKRMPPFIWIPPSGNFREARQLVPEQFAEVIGPGVKLKAVWIEPTWVFWVPTSYDKMPKWLEDNIKWVQEPGQDPVERSPPHEFRLLPTMIVGDHWR
jgi:hypothetical protein